MTNSGFEKGESATWITHTKGESAATVVSRAESGDGHLLKVTVNEAANAHVSLNHRQLSALPLDTGQMYELSFKLKGKESSFLYNRPPVSIRVIYYNGKRGKEAKHSYNWYNLRPTSQWRNYQVIIKSSDESIWKRASATIFFSRQGTYQVDDFRLLEWK